MSTATKRIAILGSCDTKGQELEFLREQIQAQGHTPFLLDVGVVGEPTISADISADQLAGRGGSSLHALREEASRQTSATALIAGAAAILQEEHAADRIGGVIGIGGTQGTSLCTQVMQSLPYGLPKVMVSTCASGDTSAFVGIKDITMMFSVGDILGLNPIMRQILANAAGAICGMASATNQIAGDNSNRPTIGMTNLGVLTEGAHLAKTLLEEAGYEVIVFHAVGSGGRAMEQMMKEGLIAGVFDYAMGEIADELFDGLRAATAERLTVAGSLGLPQVICPGGAEHIGVFVDEPNVVPAKYADHQSVFHSPLILAVRLLPQEFQQVAAEICQRLQDAKGPTCVVFPRGGTSRYGLPDGALPDSTGDAAFLEVLQQNLPAHVELVIREEHAEHPDFVRFAVEKLLDQMKISDT